MRQALRSSSLTALLLALATLARSDIHVPPGGDLPPLWLRERLIEKLAEHDERTGGARPQPAEAPRAPEPDGGSGSTVAWAAAAAGTSGYSSAPRTSGMMGPPPRPGSSMAAAGGGGSSSGGLTSPGALGGDLPGPPARSVDDGLPVGVVGGGRPLPGAMMGPPPARSASGVAGAAAAPGPGPGPSSSSGLAAQLASAASARSSMSLAAMGAPSGGVGPPVHVPKNQDELAFDESYTRGAEGSYQRYKEGMVVGFAEGQKVGFLEAYQQYRAGFKEGYYQMFWAAFEQGAADFEADVQAAILQAEENAAAAAAGGGGTTAASNMRSAMKMLAQQQQQQQQQQPQPQQQLQQQQGGGAQGTASPRAASGTSGSMTPPDPGGLGFVSPRELRKRKLASLTDAEKEDIMRRGDVDAIAPEAGAYSRLKKLASEDRKSVFEEVERLGLLEVMQVMPQGALRYQGHVPLTELPIWAEEMQLNHSRISRETAREAHLHRHAPKILSRRVMM